jgi:peptidoglycan/xylan/chitin deacetylase (PgdA/CDA1 family)
MICGLPAGGDSPMFPHAALTVFLKQTTFGGLVDGPVYATIYNNLRGIHLIREDSYKEFQDGLAVYHDDIGDYSTNEPTMDGTASLSFYLSFLEKEGLGQKKNQETATIDKYGAMIRGNTAKKQIRLIFSADEHADGMQHVLNTLSKKKVKASFFLTGNFLRNPENAKYVNQMVNDRHYVGAHSDKHLLYAPWEKRDSLLVDQETFNKDLEQNYRELARFGVYPEHGAAFLAPYEWYNSDIAFWTGSLGLRLINFSPGIGTQADYTTPDMKNYKSSQSLMDGLKKFETGDKAGLKGAIILIHPGTHPDRTDKFYLRLGELIDYLKKRGYAFERF